MQGQASEEEWWLEEGWIQALREGSSQARQEVKEMRSNRATTKLTR